MSVLPYVACAVALVLVVSVYVYRLAAGPSVFDRLLGLSAFGTTTTLVLLLTGVAYDQLDMFVDVSLAYALLSFVGAVASARYFERGGPQR
jgi:multicomponent Na+:H+ antiporter subunit F